ncbi:hypothetical protein BsWGS_03041 [Bradybaena similaris]
MERLLMQSLCTNGKTLDADVVHKWKDFECSRAQMERLWMQSLCTNGKTLDADVVHKWKEFECSCCAQMERLWMQSLCTNGKTLDAVASTFLRVFQNDLRCSCCRQIEGHFVSVPTLFLRYTIRNGCK